MEPPQKYFTAGEAAKIAKKNGIAGVPHTLDGMIKRIRRLKAEFASYDPPVTIFEGRKRRGQKGGGGTEYLWCEFPEALYTALDAEIQRRTIGIVPAVVKQISRRRVTMEKPPAYIPDRPDLSIVEEMLFHAGVKLPDGISHAEMHNSFSKMELRTVARCRVRMNNVSFFADALNAFHSRQMWVCTSGFAKNLAWVFYRDNSKFDRRKRYDQYRPGELIAVANSEDGRARYISYDAEAAAIARRATGAVARDMRQKEDFPTLPLPS